MSTKIRKELWSQLVVMGEVTLIAENGFNTKAFAGVETKNTMP